MKKELYEELDLEVIRFRTEDIITTSDATPEPEPESEPDPTTNTRETATDTRETATGSTGSPYAQTSPVEEDNSPK